MVSEADHFRILFHLYRIVGVQEVEATFNADILLDSEIFRLDNKVADYFLTIREARRNLHVTNEVDVSASNSQGLLKVNPSELGHTFNTADIIRLIDHNILCLVEI